MPHFNPSVPNLGNSQSTIFSPNFFLPHLGLFGQGRSTACVGRKQHTFELRKIIEEKNSTMHLCKKYKYTPYQLLVFIRSQKNFYWFNRKHRTVLKTPVTWIHTLSQFRIQNTFCKIVQHIELYLSNAFSDGVSTQE